MTARPILYAQRPLPLMDLSPDEFESFVYAAMQVCGPTLGIRIDQRPGAGGDGGFDAWGKRLADDAGVCIQSKRENRFALADAARELAKVAMTCVRDETSVAEHFIIVGGAVAKKLDTAVRQGSRISLTANRSRPGKK